MAEMSFWTVPDEESSCTSIVSKILQGPNISLCGRGRLCITLLCITLLCFALLCFALLCFACLDDHDSALCKGCTLHVPPARFFRWLWLKIEQEGQTAGFGPCLHLPRFHFGTGFLSHSQIVATQAFPTPKTPRKE